MELKGSKTEQNLMTAFAGEAQAYTKYQYYQSQAKKTVMYKSASISKKQQEMKKSMPSYGSNCFMME